MCDVVNETVSPLVILLIGLHNHGFFLLYHLHDGCVGGVWVVQWPERWVPSHKFVSKSVSSASVRHSSRFIRTLHYYHSGKYTNAGEYLVLYWVNYICWNHLVSMELECRISDPHQTRSSACKVHSGYIGKALAIQQTCLLFPRMIDWVDFIIQSAWYRLCETPMLWAWDKLSVAPSKAQGRWHGIPRRLIWFPFAITH